MSTVTHRRGPRQPVPELPDDEVKLEPPPAAPSPKRGKWKRMLMMAPMLLMPLAMGAMFLGGGRGAMGGGLFALAMVGMMAASMMRQNGGGDDSTDERAEYLRYLEGQRRAARDSARRQRLAMSWSHPDPATLPLTVHGERLWERQPTDADFGEIRVGRGRQPSALRLVPPDALDLDELDPVGTRALRGLLNTYVALDDLPIAVNLLAFARVHLSGESDAVRGLARAVLAQLVHAHSPQHVLVALAAPEEGEWGWLKWLPHHQHRTDHDGAGRSRLFASTVSDLERQVLKDVLAGRGRFEADAVPTAEEPLVVVLVDGQSVPAGSRLATSGYRGVLVLDVDGCLPWRADKLSLRLGLRSDELWMMVTERGGEEMEEVLGAPDTLSPDAVLALARSLARWQVSGAEGSPTDAGGGRSVDLCDLLELGDPETFDPLEYWRRHGAHADLRVPIGLDERGHVVELDIREAARGGTGPHGMLVGATGSGKSELLRTLVLGMALRHSSEHLNLVLVDFKGGATFLGLERLPHVAAVITNLADELPLVARMQDSLHGEMVRRQEMLRAYGNASVLDHERARAEGADIPPMPTLFLVIDEFSELLAANREFLNLFVMVGRLGRSLGVHLLLATQRIEEGRVHSLEGHLSYRIGLRTFSAGESRSVLGVTDAYDVPLPPGGGFMKTGQGVLQRFRGAYVSGKLQRRTGGTASSPQLLAAIQPFGCADVPMPDLPEPEEEPEEEPDDAPQDSRTLLEVLATSLEGSGPPAHRVWLPPLDESACLDELLGGVEPVPGHGLGAPAWSRGPLRVPLGIIDKPFEQKWDVLTADLSGAAGHVGIAGAAQSGKSTLLRTLILAVSLLNTPSAARFYCLDFGSGGLGALGRLPHVGGVASRRDADMVRRSVRETVAALDRRERTFAALGIDTMADARRLRGSGEGGAHDLADIFLVVDGWFTIRQEFEDLEPLFQQIVTRGLPVGVHLVITSQRWSDVRTWLRDALGTKLELHLGEAADSAIGGRAAKNVPAIPGRGLTTDAMHFLAALPRLDGVGDPETMGRAMLDAVAAVSAASEGGAAPEIRTLPLLLPRADLPAPRGGGQAGADVQVPIGLGESDLQPLWWDFGRAPHLVVFGDSETGKTGLLRALAHDVAAAYEPGQVEILLGDYRRELQEAVPAQVVGATASSTESLAAAAAALAERLRERVPEEGMSADRLRRRDWWTGPRFFVLVDDSDLFVSSGFGATSPLADLAALMPHGADIGLHVIVARATSGGSRGMSDPAIRRAWELSNQALLLSCPREEGVIFGTTRPATLPPGRAQLITRRGSGLVQLAFLPDTPDGTVG